MRLADRLRAALDAPHSAEIMSGEFAELAPGPRSDAAVLVAVTDRPEPGVILTQRTEHLSRHAGQVAFPGGRVDPEDSDLPAAALREAEEEIGLPRAVPEVVGIADRYYTYTGFDITPVVAVIPPDLPLVAHAGEVAAIFEVPFAWLLDPTNHGAGSLVFKGQRRSYFEMLWAERRIWGVTAAMIVNLARRLGHAVP